MTYTLGIDASRWDTRIDWQTLKAGGVDFAILKTSQGRAARDPRFERHLDGALQAGMICGAYHWCDPLHDVKQQAANFLEATTMLPVAFAAVDVEQYWQDWSEWQRHSVTRKISPRRISQSALNTASEIKAGSGLPVLIYTRASFVRDFAAPMQAWLAQFDLWLAHYPYGSQRETCSWEQLVEHLPASSEPPLPPGCYQWRFWQFSAEKFILPGASSPLDLNFFNGDLAQLKRWCRIEPNPAPIQPVDPAEKLTRLWDAHPEIHPSTEE